MPTPQGKRINWLWLLWGLLLGWSLISLHQSGTPESATSQTDPAAVNAKDPMAWFFQVPGAEPGSGSAVGQQTLSVKVNERQQLVVEVVESPESAAPAAAPSNSPSSPQESSIQVAAAPKEGLTDEDFYRLLRRYEGALQRPEWKRRSQGLPQHWLTDIVKKYAKLYAIDPRLVWTVIRHESGFNPRAVSPKGAMGLMQLIPSTAALMGVNDPFDIEENIHGGVKYLKYCLSRFGNNIVWALAAYNAGPDNVVKYQGCPPFAETRTYVLRIMRDYTGQEIQLPPVLLAAAKAPSPLAAANTAPEKTSGLNWKVPEPKVKLGAPTWKIPLRPTLVLAKIPTPLRQNPEVSRLLAKHNGRSQTQGPPSP